MPSPVPSATDAATGSAPTSDPGSQADTASARAATAHGRASTRRRHPWRRRVLVLLLALALVAAAALAFAVQHRQEQERLGLGAVSAPEAPRTLEHSSGRTGAFTADVSFTTMATGAATVTAPVRWDDAWFFEDPTAYNHDLARACAVLSAVANAESAYYQAGSTAPAYLEEALAALGFDDISTASYRYRSEIFDEVVDFITGTDDVVAYSVATKRVTGPNGQEKTLYLVSVRGSYGAEWLSDLNMGDAAHYEMQAIDHEGFMRAASEIVDDLVRRITADVQDAGTDDVALLFCGHSRGAATANLAASYADDMTQGLRALAPLESIYCYTFATPELTQMDTVGDALYDNIFNILNPSDIVPRMPLASWGYARYGRDLALPGFGDEGFDERFARMRATFKELCGVENPYVPEDRVQVDALIENIGAAVPTADDLATPGGVVSTVGNLFSQINPLQVLYGHYPSVYIAWMYALDAAELSPAS